jgi:hypothetical protein
MMVMPPAFIHFCKSEADLNKDMQSMLDNALVNIKLGYDLQVDELVGCVENGMTVETFNMLAMNLNGELHKQFESRDYLYERLIESQGMRATKH